MAAAEAIGRDIAELTVPEVGQEVAADIMAAVRDGISWWITPEAAFELLAESARERQATIWDVSRRVLAGDLPM